MKIIMENKIKNTLAKSYLSLLKAKTMKEGLIFSEVNLADYSIEELLNLIEITAKSLQREKSLEKSLKELENDIKDIPLDYSL